MQETDKARAELVRIDAGLRRYDVDRWPAGPWRLRDWVFATDGHVLTALAHSFIGGEYGEAPEASLKLANKFLDLVSVGATPIMAADLKAFAYIGSEMKVCARCDNSRRIECDSCDGSGDIDCECMSRGDEHSTQCKSCGGRGDRQCPDCSPTAQDERVGRLLGELVNRIKLKDALSPAMPEDSEVISVSVESNGTHPIILLRGDGWMSLVSPMQHVKTAVEFEKPETWLASAQADDAVARCSTS